LAKETGVDPEIARTCFENRWLGLRSCENYEAKYYNACLRAKQVSGLTPYSNALLLLNLAGLSLFAGISAGLRTY
jgi:hypothetical protein